MRHLGPGIRGTPRQPRRTARRCPRYALPPTDASVPRRPPAAQLRRPKLHYRLASSDSAVHDVDRVGNYSSAHDRRTTIAAISDGEAAVDGHLAREPGPQRQHQQRQSLDHSSAGRTGRPARVGRRGNRSTRARSGDRGLRRLRALSERAHRRRSTRAVRRQGDHDLATAYPASRQPS